MQPQIQKLLDYLNRSPTSWHAVENAIQILESAGFTALDPKTSWKLQPKSKYYLVHNSGSTLCAFITPISAIQSLKIISTHTDSPSFKLKPNAEFIRENMMLLGLEVYGAPLITSWLNRDLGIAGRISYIDADQQLKQTLVNLTDAPVMIPQLAIHLDRQVNETGAIINKQDQLAALAGFIDANHSDGFLQTQIKKQLPFLKKILSTDLFVYPLEQARCLGYKQEMIAGYRIDNLHSVHAGLEALSQTDPTENSLQMLMMWDHEEVGSTTASGAGSPFFTHTLERITLALQTSREDYLKLLNHSLSLSVDLAHATHPNYFDRHEPRHPVWLNKGIALKFNAQQRYATDSYAAGIMTRLCDQLNISYQSFVTRGDIPCGTTIGPIHANQSGIQAVDIGAPQLSMHSCRELAAVNDYFDLIKLLQAFLT